MAYGSQLMSLGNDARNRGQQSYESGLSRLMQASAMASEQAHQSREARRQREAQEAAQKKAEKAQKKAMWTSLGINAGTGAVGGAITGGLAAGLGGSEAVLPAAGLGAAGGGSIGAATSGVSAATAPAAQIAATTPVGINLAAQPQLTAAFNPPRYQPFAGGNVGLGAAAGGALGALGGLSGQNYLGSALAMPGQNYALANDAFNTANNQAMQWAKFAQSDRQNEADNNAAMERAKIGADTRATVAQYPWMFGVKPDTQARVDASIGNNQRSNQTRTDINASRLPFLQQNADTATRRADIMGRGMDLRQEAIDEDARQFDIKSPIDQQNADSRTNNSLSFGKSAANRGNSMTPDDLVAIRNDLESAWATQDVGNLQSSIDSAWGRISRSNKAEDQTKFLELLRRKGWPKPRRLAGTSE